VQIRNRIKELRQVKASELMPNPRNWRKHPTGQADALRGALAEIGYADALIAYETDEGLMLIDGHLRAETTPDMEVPVLITDLDEGEANKLLMTLDPLSAMASADADIFDALRQVTTVESDALQEMLDAIAGGNLKSLETMQKPKVGLTDPDEVPPEAEEPWVQLGDLFQLGEHRLMCGDVLNAMPSLMGDTKAVLLTTDPPYGDSWVDKAKDMHAHGYGHSRAVLHGSIESDDKTPKELAVFLASWLKAIKVAGDPPFPIYVWHGAKRIIFEQALVDAGYLVHQPIIWVKPSFVIGRLHYHPRCEWALHGWLQGGGKCPFYGERNQSDVWQLERENDGLHPTQKPTRLFEIPIENHTKNGEVVLDPFLGSGTTLIAAEKLDRICYGMEIEPRYVQVAIERWQNYTGQKAVKL